MPSKRVFWLASIPVFFATPLAWSQSSATDPDPDDQQTMATVVVTGSRIARPDYETSNPIVSVDATAIQNSGRTNVTDLLRQLPALVGSQSSNDSAGSNPNNFIGGTGLNLLDLRNLGFDRTLVLVNGRRHVATVPGSAAIDTNTIPVDLIERIDITTGGASAIYGADGVSGVVNFVMRDNFQGLQVRSQFGSPELGGNTQRFLSALAGTNFSDGRGNVAFSVEFSHDSSLSSLDRRFTGTGETRFVRNPNDPGDDPNIPDRIPLSGLQWFGSGRGGAVDVDTDLLPDFNGNTDAAWDYGAVPGGISGETYQQGGSGTPTGGYQGDLLPDEKRIATNIFGHFDLNDNVRFFTELKYVNTKSKTVAQPTFDYFLWIDTDNPFIPTNIAAAAPTNGDPLLVTRDNFDFGIRGEDIKRETYRAVAGVEGKLTDWLRYNLSAVYGETDVRSISVNNRFNDRFAAALDAVIDPGTGQPTCRSNLDPSAVSPNIDWEGFAAPTSFTPGAGSGCVPINIFGEGSPSQAALDWIMVNSPETNVVAQKVATAYVSGDLDRWIKLPAGSIGFAVGGEWRRESAHSVPALEDQQGITFGNKIAPTFGRYQVREAFAEVNVPLLDNRRFAHKLSIDGAERYSHYSTVGNTSTWKLGLLWAPIEDISIRGTKASAVRAPNISELFSPGGQTFLFIDDPCDPTFIGLGTSFRAANCAALLSSLGADPDNYIDPNPGTSRPGLLIGNVNLEEETADTKTVGVVLRPRFIQGLILAVDYYDINLTNAINTLDPQDISDQCVDLPTLDNQFCTLVTRTAGGASAGEIVDFTQQPVNVAAFRTKGYDFSLSYDIDPAKWGRSANWGVFHTRLIGNYLKQLFFVNLQGANPDPDYGEKQAPTQQVNFNVGWERRALSLNYGVQYFSTTQRYTFQQRTAQPDIAARRYLNYNAHVTHDIQARFGLDNGISIYAGVNNFTDERPDIGESFYPVDALGRVFYAGAQFTGFGK